MDEARLIVEAREALQSFLFGFDEVVKKDGYQAALQRFTGAKAHARLVLEKIKTYEVQNGSTRATEG